TKAWVTTAAVSQSGPPELRITGSYIADRHPLFKRSKRVSSFGDEFLGDKSFVAGLEYRTHDGRIIQFLSFVDLCATGHATSVVVGDVLMVFLNCGHDIAFHDLHVVDIIQELAPV